MIESFSQDSPVKDVLTKHRKPYFVRAKREFVQILTPARKLFNAFTGENVEASRAAVIRLKGRVVVKCMRN